MQSIIQEAHQALQREQFEICRSLICDSLGRADDPADRRVLLEMLAQAQTALDDLSAAAETWEQAYRLATTPAAQASLFERACQSYERTQNYAALERLAQSHSRCATTPYERAKSLLIAGEALMRQQRRREARQRYFEPALGLTDMRPELRAYLWHDVGLSYLGEQDFAAAAAAFQTVSSMPLAVRLPTQRPSSPAQLFSAQQLQTASHFYRGIIHLMYHRPHQAVQAIAKAQPPPRTGTKLDRANAALFLALAHCRLQQPDAAERALRTLPKTSELPRVLHGPQALIRVGIANLRQDTTTAGEQIEAALGTSLRLHATWEPSWRGLLYEELGQALYHTGFRQAAIATYEDALKVLAHRIGPWRDTLYIDWLRGHSLFSALDNLPLHTWPASVGGDMLRLLQRLITLYDRAQYGTLADFAFRVALRLSATPTQRAVLWLQYGWLIAMQPPNGQPDTRVEWPSRAECIKGVQQAGSQCPSTPLTMALEGVEALLSGDEAGAQHAFAQVPDIPEAPESRGICLAAWLWAHASTGQLEQVLSAPQAAAPTLWQTGTLLADALTFLFNWVTSAAVPPQLSPEAWLVPLLDQHKATTLSALRFLKQPHVLPEAQRLTLRQTLTRLCTRPAIEQGADEVAELLGGAAILDRIEVLLAALDQCQTPVPVATKRSARRPKMRHRNPVEPANTLALHGARLRHLILRLAPDMPALAGDRHLPETIHRWLVQYPNLVSRVPEVVGALLRLLSTCPMGHTVIPAVLAQVTLSKRQRQALEAPSPPTLQVSRPSLTLSDWDAPRIWPLARLFDRLSTSPSTIDAARAPSSDAYQWYTLALIFCRVGLHERASDCLQKCLHLDPDQPLVHYQLAHLLRQQQRYQTAIHHALTAWQTLQAWAPITALLHLEMLNSLLVLLGITGQHDDLPNWFATFERCHAELKLAPLSEDEQQQLREEEGRLALSQAMHLSSLPRSDQTSEHLERQLGFLAQAIAKGPPPTQRFALHRQSDTLRRLQREDDAVQSYTRLIQQWPDDRRARFRLCLLTAVRQAKADDQEADRALTEALSLAFANTDTPPSPLTPQSALHWFERATPHDSPYLDVTDALTAYGQMLLKRRVYVQAIDILTPLYTRIETPWQAYYLAEAHYACSQQEMSKADRQRECNRALGYAHAALESDLHQQEAQTLLQQIQADHRRLVKTKRSTTTLGAYRQQVSALFTRHSVPYTEHLTEKPADAPWVALYEQADLEEDSGNPIVTVQLCFNRNAEGENPCPSVKDVSLYARHQQDAQQLMHRYGISALAWIQIAYDGETPFEKIFPERLVFNRDLLVLAYSEPKSLVRYTQVLQVMTEQLGTLSMTSSPPDTSTLITAARHLVVVPLVHKRLSTLAQSDPSIAGSHPIDGIPDATDLRSLVERLQNLPAFADAYLYFDTIASTLSDDLEKPLVNMAILPDPAERARRSKGRIRNNRGTPTKRRRQRRQLNGSAHAADALLTAANPKALS